MTRRAAVLTGLSLLVVLLLVVAMLVALADHLWSGADAVDLTPNSSSAELAASARAAEPLAEPAAREELPNVAPTPITPVGTAAVRLTAAVRVVRAGSSAPVPGAEVAVMPQKFAWSTMTAAEKDVVFRFGRDEVAMLAHFGSRVRADADGRLQLAIVNELFLACDHQGHFGQLHVQASELRRDGEHLLVLKPETALRVRVTGSDGQPVVGLEVGLRPLWSEPAVAALHATLDGFVGFAFTDQHGCATLARVRGWVEDYAAKGRPDRAAVRLSACGLTEDAFTFELATPPPHVVELVAPALGEVLVKALDVEGRPLGDVDDFVLGLADAPAQGRWGGCAAGLGAARFAHVALGRRYEAAFTGLGSVAPQVFLGPTAAGQSVVVELRATHERPAFVGQLSESEGLGVVSLWLHLSGPEFTNTHLAAKADTTGRFRCELDDDWVGEPITRVVVQQRPRDEVAPLVATLDRPFTIARGDNDLGLIALQRAPQLVAGAVRVAGEPPEQRPEVTVQVHHAEGFWYDLRTATVLWSAPGQFEAVGPPGVGRHRLTASSADCLPAEPIEFVPGQRDLRIELQQGGALRCGFLLDDPELVEHVAFTLAPTQPSPAAERALRARGRLPEGQLELAEGVRPAARVWRGLLPGSYRLTAHVLGSERPLVELDALEVLAGATCTDARVVAIDLRSKLRRLQLRVLDREGAPLAETAAAVVTAGGATLGVMVARGAATLLTAGPVDLQVSASGYRSATASGVVGTHTVRLTPLPTFALALPQLHVPPGVTAMLRVVPGGLPVDQIDVRLVNVPRQRGWQSKPPESSLPLGTARDVEIAYRVGESLALRVELTGAGRTVAVAGHLPEVVAPTGTRVAVEIPTSAWREALAKVTR